jgi:hypothetical protein
MRGGARGTYPKSSERRAAMFFVMSGGYSEERRSEDSIDSFLSKFRL